MKFKLVENYNIRKSVVQEYIDDAIEELGNASLEEYVLWFSALDNFDDEVRQIVKDSYIEAIDYGKIDLPKTMITSELTTYLESNADIIDKDIDELINNCPDHLRHELTLVLDRIDDPLTEELLKESPEDHKFIYEARFKTPDGEYELFTDDYNSFSRMMYEYYMNNEDSEVLIHVLELQLNNFNELKFIDKHLTVPEKSSIKIINETAAKVETFKDISDVVRYPWRRTAEENKILSDEELTDSNRLLLLWKECHDSKYKIRRLNQDFMEISVTPKHKKEHD